MVTNVSTVDRFESAIATVAFVDLAGFSAITDVYGDASAIAVLGRFEELVRQALGGLGPPIKWIGDEAMFGFPDPATALQVLGRLLPACRSEPRIPLTRTGLNHGHPMYTIVDRRPRTLHSFIEAPERRNPLASSSRFYLIGPLRSLRGLRR